MQLYKGANLSSSPGYTVEYYAVVRTNEVMKFAYHEWIWRVLC